MKAIEVESVVKKFGDLAAVNGISLEVRSGEVFGFLGPNGAGKTTTMKILSTLLRPTSGRGAVNGFDLDGQRQQVRQSIGMIFQDSTLDDRLTAHENLKFHAMLYDVPRKIFDSRSMELLKLVELADKVDQPIKTFSGGMRRRLEIVRGLLHHPDVLFLDEPTIGLDPQTRRHIWEYLLRLRSREGVTMFMTTHYMDEAEHCDRIAIIDHGVIVALDTPQALKSLVGGDIVTVCTTDNESAIAKLMGADGVNLRPGPDQHIIIETARGDKFIPEMIARLANGDAHIEVLGVNISRPTLEDVFIKLTGRTIRPQEVDGLDRMQMGARMWMGRKR